MTATTSRNARSRTQRGLARAALETQRKKVKLQEDHLTALFTHLDGIDQARLQAGEQVTHLRELGLTLSELAELTGEPVNRLSWLSRLGAEDDDDAADTDEAEGEDTKPGSAPAGDQNTDPTEGRTPEDERRPEDHHDNPVSTSTSGGNSTPGGRVVG